MQEIFDQAVHDSDSPISSSIAAMGKGAGRLALSIVRSLAYLPGSVAANFRQILSLDNLWCLAVVLCAWVIATVIGGPVGLAINGILIIYGLRELYNQVSASLALLRQWAAAAYSASNDAELDVAAQVFAEAIGQGALTAIEVVVTHRVFARLRAPLKKRFPAPDWLKGEYEKAIEKGETRTEQARRGPLEKLADRIKSTAERGPLEKLADRTKSTAELVADAGRAQAAAHPPDFPVVPVVVGVLAATAVVGGIALAVSGGSRGR